MIKPTVGRIVWYHPEHGEMVDLGDQPCAAMVIYVWGNDCVNLKIVDHEGNTHTRTSVHLCQDSETPVNGQCEWMPYQKQVAAGEITPTLHATPTSSENIGA